MSSDVYAQMRDTVLAALRAVAADLPMTPLCASR